MSSHRPMGSLALSLTGSNGSEETSLAYSECDRQKVYPPSKFFVVVFFFKRGLPFFTVCEKFSQV